MQLAADSGIAAPSISAALEARFVSSKLELRRSCAEVFAGVAPDASSSSSFSEAGTRVLVHSQIRFRSPVVSVVCTHTRNVMTATRALASRRLLK